MDNYAILALRTRQVFRYPLGWETRMRGNVMAILMDEQSVAQRILEHIEHGTTDLGQSVWREPVDNYRSKERMAAEVELAFRRSSAPFCPSALLPRCRKWVTM
jgi:hypothetical protein